MRVAATLRKALVLGLSAGAWSGLLLPAKAVAQTPSSPTASSPGAPSPPPSSETARAERLTALMADGFDVPVVQSPRARLHVRVWRHKGTTYLTATGRANTALYLCCTQYPQVFRNGMLEGSHVVLPVSGDFRHTWSVDPSFVGGYFEIDLWGQMVPAARCTLPNDPWCEQGGFHLEDSAASSSGGFETP